MKKIIILLVAALILVTTAFGILPVGKSETIGNNDGFPKNVYWSDFGDNGLIKGISQILILPNGSMLCISEGRIVKSINEGQDFILSNFGINGEIKKVMIDNNVLYAFSSDTVYRSEDMGSTWKDIKKIQSDALVCASVKSGTVYAGTFLGKALAISESGIEVVLKNLPTIYCVFSPNNSNFLFVGTEKGMYVYNFGNKSVISTNLPKDESVAFIGNFNKKIFVVTHKIINHGDEHYINSTLWSSENGIDFKMLKKFEFLSVRKIVQANNHFYCITENNGVLYSNNLISWKTESAFGDISEINAFCVEPISNNKEKIFIYSKDKLMEKVPDKPDLFILRKYYENLQINRFFRESGDHLYAATNYGVFLKGPAGLKSTGLDKHNVEIISQFRSVLYAGTDKGLFVYEDEAWKPTAIQDKVFNLLTTDNYLFIATNSGLYRISKDEKIDKIANPKFENGVYSLCYYSGKLYAGTPFVNSSGLFVSADNGKTWEQIPNTPGTDITSIYVTSKGIFIGTWVMGVYFTSDNGATWITLNNGLNDLNITSFASYKERLICGTTSGIYYYDTTNENWNPIGSKLDHSRIVSIYSDKNDLLVASWNGAFSLSKKPLIAENGKGKILLSWIDFPESIQISRFELFRKSLGSDQWILLGKFDNAVHSYSDDSIEAKKKYFYILKSFDDLNPPNCFVSNEVEIISDSEPPTLTINSPQNGLETSESEITVKGTAVDMDSGLSTLTINGNNVSVSSGGSFSYAVTLEEGENAIKIVVTDKAGNKATKTLTITYTPPVKTIVITLKPGDPYMTVNGVEQEIDPGRGTKPVIIPKWGRTVVPIRAIVEALGGTIGWDPVQRMVTINLGDNTINLWIGKPKASVNGEMKWIDEKDHSVKPIIVNGRTMLPLRFVVENLGCSVDWDPKTKTITITYTP